MTSGLNVFAIQKADPISFSSLDNLLENDFFFKISRKDFSQDITNSQASLTMLFDPFTLAVSKVFPQIIKIEIYQVDESNNENLISVVNQSYKSTKQLKSTLIKVPLPSLSESSNILIKFYNSEGVEVGIFSTNIQIMNNSVEGNPNAVLEDVVCDDHFGECQMDFIMRNLNLVVSSTKEPATIITKEKSGEYTARIPLASQGSKKVKTVNKIVGASSSGVNKTSKFEFEDTESQVKAEMGWDEITDSLKISFPGSDRSFSFSEEGLLNISQVNQVDSSEELSSLSLQDGDSSQVPIKIEAGDLTTTLVDGAIEYDGDELYFTSRGSRRSLGSSTTTVIGGTGSSTTLTGPTNSLMLKTGANDLTGSGNLDFVAGTLRVANAIVFQSLNSQNFTGPQTIDWSTGNQKRITLDGNTTLSFLNPAGFCSLLLEINQDATGSRTITWPASVLWSGGTAPILSTAPNSIDVVTCFFNGTNYLCQVGLDFQ